MAIFPEAFHIVVPIVEQGFTVKQCGQCGLVLPFTSFSRNRSRKDGLNHDCKLCHTNRAKQWRKNNPHKNRAKKARRRAAKRQATPPWASHSEIQKHYAHAAHLETLLPGCRFEVDHIVPLKSDFVCGLHVENNLMVLEASQNASKSNQWWPDQLPCQTGSGPSQSWWNKLNNKICNNALGKN